MYVHTYCSICTYRLDRDMLVKVADFGLSRDIYVSDYYRLEHSTPLPVKWLALEAIFDGMFTVKSDVVSINVKELLNQKIIFLATANNTLFCIITS